MGRSTQTTINISPETAEILKELAEVTGITEGELKAQCLAWGLYAIRKTVADSGRLTTQRKIKRKLDRHSAEVQGILEDLTEGATPDQVEAIENLNKILLAK